MTMIDVPASAVSSHELAAGIRVARHAARRAVQDGYPWVPRAFDAIADALEAEERRRISGRGVKVTAAMVDDDDDDPTEVDIGRRLAVTMAYHLAKANEPGPLGVLWGDIAASLASARDSDRHALQDVERAYGAPVVSREAPG